MTDGEVTALDLGRVLLHRNSTKGGRPSEFPLLGRKWDLLPGVFAPIYDVSTQLFTAWLPYPIGGSFLEIGCGAGVTAVTAALRGCARVTALDINDRAIENAIQNARRHGVAERVRVLRSNLFAEVPQGERFDCVFWNSSFIEASPNAALDALELAIFDPGYRTHAAFLNEVSAHSAPGGRIFLGFSDLGNGQLLKSLADQAHLELQTVRSFTARHPVTLTYQLLELIRT